jgi:membrane protein
LISQSLRTDPLQVEPILEVLVGLGWVGRLDESQGEDGGRYVLLCDPAQVLLAPLAVQTLLQPDEWTQGIWLRTGMANLPLKDALGA